MKIAFVGAECTGKTTMSKLLAERLGMEHIPDPYERAVEMCGLPDAWNTKDREYKWKFEKAMHAAQFEMEEGKISFVADSASLVRAACGLYLCQDAPQNQLAALVSASLAYADSYDVLIHLSPEDVLYVDNGHRFMNTTIREGIDWMIRGMLSLVETKIVWWNLDVQSIDQLAKVHCAEKLQSSK